MRCVPNELCWVTKATCPGNVGRVVMTKYLRSDGNWEVEPMGGMWIFGPFSTDWYYSDKPFPWWIDSFSIEDAYLLPFRNLGEKDLQVPAPPARRSPVFEWPKHLVMDKPSIAYRHPLSLSERARKSLNASAQKIRRDASGRFSK